jgi:hypothetical protein
MGKLHFNLLRWLRNSVGTQDSLRFSRRYFLQGGAATALTPIISRAVLGSRVAFQCDGARCVFLLDGAEAWVIDPLRFAGDGHLCINTPSRNRIEIGIEGFRYPGTLVHVDGQITVEHGLFGWMCRFTLPKHGITRRFRLESWLEGQHIEWHQRAFQRLISADSPVQVCLPGPSILSLDRSWNMTWKGDVELSIDGSQSAVSFFF